MKRISERMYLNLIASLPFIFIVSILVGMVIYFIGRTVAAKGEKTAGKVAPYACGEDLPPGQFQIDIGEFLVYAIYFLIFDVLAFTLATSMGNAGYFPMVYVVVVLMAVASLTILLK
ncbi:MAG: NADH-quinone oxidoreductase subunit A [Candidatus Bathyarchaeota archaeon]|jgi:NADH:ubiquinone oxidoreductase subunit 3 (subunit A)